MNAFPENLNPVRPISAVDAIAPAFRRMRSILAAPFRLGLFLKICLFVALTESGFFSATFSYPFQGMNAAAQGKIGSIHHGSRLVDGFSGFGAIGAGLLLLFLVLGLVAFVIWVICVYLFCRLRFTVLDLAIYREGSIRRAWRKYGRQSWRYFGLTILTVLAFLLVMAAVVGPFIPAIIRTARTMDPAHPNPFALFGIMLPLFGAILLLSLLGMVIDAVIRDFLLPPMAIEDAPLESALHRFVGLLRQDFGGVVLYLFMRFVVSIAVSATLAIVCILPIALLAVLAFLVGVGLYHSLWLGGGQILFVAYVVATGGVLLVLYLLALVSVYGVNGVFKLCYGVTFFGARYPALGELLEPGMRQQVAQELPPTPPPSAGILPAIEPPPVW